MEIHQEVLFVDATTGFYRISRHPLGPFYGPIDRFEKDKTEAALDFWYEVHKGTHEALREF